MTLYTNRDHVTSVPGGPRPFRPTKAQCVARSLHLFGRHRLVLPSCGTFGTQNAAQKSCQCRQFQNEVQVGAVACSRATIRWFKVASLPEVLIGETHCTSILPNDFSWCDRLVRADGVCRTATRACLQAASAAWVGEHKWAHGVHVMRKKEWQRLRQRARRQRRQ